MHKSFWLKKLSETQKGSVKKVFVLSGKKMLKNVLKKILKLENGTRRAQIPQKPLIFPSRNKQTNRQRIIFVHSEVRPLDPRIFSTMLLPTEL